MSEVTAITIYASMVGALLLALELGGNHLENKRQASRRAHYDQLYALARAEDSED